MKNGKKIEGAQKKSSKIKVSKKLARYSGKVLFPKQLAKANEILSQVKNIDILYR